MNGLWSVTEAASHINVLELRTVVLALLHFLPRLSGQHVLVRTSALAYILRHCTIGRTACSCGQRFMSFPSGQFIFQVTSTTGRTCCRGATLKQQIGVYTLR